MKLTYIILAHKNPKQLQRLINRLSSDHVNFVIHVDSRCDINDFKRVFTDLDFRRVFFIVDRLATNWGSFNLVQATLNCLIFVVDSLPDTQRVLFLSGQDYPIKCNRYIETYLSANPNTIYMEFDEVPHKRWKDGGMDRFPLFQEISEQIKIFAGSQWMSFPVGIARIILDFLDENPDFIFYFKLVKIPDESFFQTLLLNCGHDLVEKNLVNSNLHDIKWEYPYAHPRFLGEESMNRFKRSKNLFARKFEGVQPSKILDRIDNELLTKETIEKDILPVVALQKIADHREVILFLTNKNDEETLGRYQRIKRSVGDRFDVYFLYHQTGTSLPSSLSKQEVFSFDEDLLNELSFDRIYKELLPGSNHFPLFLFYEKKTNYSHYWVIEDDVVYNGDIGDFFACMSNYNSDFISSHLRDYRNEPQWYWWQTLRNSAGLSIPLSRRVRSFNPIFRITNRALFFLAKTFDNGWSGHHEVTIPTLLKMAGYQINDFGGAGPYVIEGLERKFYRPVDPGDTGELQSGSMRYRPIIAKEELTEAILYHPVKI